MTLRSLLLCAAGAFALTACQTTGSSNISSTFGIRSNFQPTHERLDGSFLETIDMAAVAEDQSDLTNEDMRNLALRDDPDSQRGFFGMVHASMFNDQPSYHHLVGDRGPSEYLNGLLQEVLTGWDGPAPEIAVVVTADSSLRGAAHKENFIAIPIGVLINAESEDEIAALLAHEAGHLLLGHVGGSNDSRRQERMLNDALDHMGQFSATMRTTRTRTNSDGTFEVYTVQDQEAEEQLFGVSLATQASREIARNFLFPSMNRELEEHADLIGVDLMTAAGFNPAGMETLLARTADQQREVAQDVERLNEAQRAQATLSAERLGVNTSGGFLNMLAWEGALGLYEQVRGRANQSYRSFEQRSENTLAYIEKNYFSEYNIRPVREDGLSQFLASREGRIVSAYETAFEARAKLNEAMTLGRADRNYQPLLDEARRLVNQALSAGGIQESQIRFIEFQIHHQRNEPNLAFNALVAAADKPSASAETLEYLARLYIDRNRTAEARAILDRQVDLMGTELVAMPMYLEVAIRENDRELAEAWLERCEQTENERAVPRCREVAVEAGLIEEEEESNMLRALTSGIGS
ncbi:MAG: M48 family metalloprotease [Oceanicaulis sp.]